MALLCLYLNSICSETTNEIALYQLEIPAVEWFENGGAEVLVFGLTEDPIEVEFPNYKEEMSVSLSIYSKSGILLYQLNTNKTSIDCTLLEFQEGEKYIEIQVGTELIAINI